MSSEAQRENVSSLTVTEPLSVHINLHKSSVCAHVDGLQTLYGSRTVFPRSPLRALQSATAAPRHITMLSGVDGGGGGQWGVCVFLWKWTRVLVDGKVGVCVRDGCGMCTTAAPAASVKTAFGLLQTQDRIVACVLACVCVRACMRAC